MGVTLDGLGHPEQKFLLETPVIIAFLGDFFSWRIKMQTRFILPRWKHFSKPSVHLHARTHSLRCTQASLEFLLKIDFTTGMSSKPINYYISANKISFERRAQLGRPWLRRKSAHQLIRGWVGWFLTPAVSVSQYPWARCWTPKFLLKASLDCMCEWQPFLICRLHPRG